MAGSVNKAILVGHCGKDPEIRTTQSGEKIAHITLATSERWKDRNSGEQKERTEWHRVVVLNDGLADVVERYVRKGSLIYVEGKLQTRKWTDQSGQERYTTEVALTRFDGKLTLLDRAKDGDGQRSAEPSGGRPGSMSDRHRDPGAGASPGRAPGDLDDEIPFGVPWQ